MTQLKRSSINRRDAIAASLAAMSWPGATFAQAADWKPTRPIRLICSQAPGASTDATARAYSDYFSQKLGVPVTVENKPGGVGMVAGEAVARSTPDGTTLLVSLQSVMAQMPVLIKKPTIDPDKDLLPIAAIGVGPVVASTHVDAGFRGPAYEDLAEMNILMAPAGTPQIIIDTLARLVSASVTDSARVKSVRETLGADDMPLVGAELQHFISRSWPTYRKLSREMGLAAE